MSRQFPNKEINLSQEEIDEIRKEFNKHESNESTFDKLNKIQEHGKDD